MEQSKADPSPDAPNRSSLLPEPRKLEPRKPALEKDPFTGFDLAPHRRPGDASHRGIKPWPNSRWPISPQPRRVEVFMHGRPGKTFPPVFGTDVPPCGLSGQLRRLAYGYPDHLARHWLLKLFADRVDSFEYRARKALPLLLPAVIGGLIVRSRMR